jgi:hypothetical protein
MIMGIKEKIIEAEINKLLASETSMASIKDTVETLGAKDEIISVLKKIIIYEKTPTKIREAAQKLLDQLVDVVDPVDPVEPVVDDGKLRTMFLFKSPVTGLPTENTAGYASTLAWWSSKWTEDQRNVVCQFLRDSGANCIVTLIRCAETDMSRAEIMAAIKGSEGERFKTYGLQHIIVYLSDDHQESFDDLDGHPGWIADLSAAALVSLVTVPMILIGMEVGESDWWTNDRGGWVCQEFRGHLGGTIKVGVHISWGNWQKNTELVVQADVIALEWPWGPSEAPAHTDADFNAILTLAVDKAGSKSLAAAEYAINGGSDQAKRWGKLALDAGCIGAWTGF